MYVFSLLFPVIPPSKPPPITPPPVPSPVSLVSCVSVLAASDRARGAWRTSAAEEMSFAVDIYHHHHITGMCSESRGGKAPWRGICRGRLNVYIREIFAQPLQSALKLGPDVSLWEPPALERNFHVAMQAVVLVSSDPQSIRLREQTPP